MLLRVPTGSQRLSAGIAPDPARRHRGRCAPAASCPDPDRRAPFLCADQDSAVAVGGRTRRCRGGARCACGRRPGARRQGGRSRLSGGQLDGVADLAGRLRAAGCVFADDEARIYSPRPQPATGCSTRNCSPRWSAAANGANRPNTSNGGVEFAGPRLSVGPVFIPRRRSRRSRPVWPWRPWRPAHRGPFSPRRFCGSRPSRPWWRPDSARRGAAGRRRPSR